MRSLGIEGVWAYDPKIFADDRGAFLEVFQGDPFREDVGHPLRLAQMNLSVSRRGTLRGIHFADVPPGQAKYVTCVRGAVLDVAVDIREGSPTFGEWASLELDEHDRRAIYLAEGLGHAFLALTDEATVTYLCSEPYRPEGEHEINPLDPALNIDWPSDVAPLLSDKDAAAPTLAEARERGLLPSYEACLQWYASAAPSG